MTSTWIGALIFILAVGAFALLLARKEARKK
jgi:hypothetical protein